MGVRQYGRSPLRQLWLPAIAAVYLGYFGFHAFHGSYGILAKAELKQEQKELAAELADLQGQTAALERHVALLRPTNVDADMIDEQARRALNFIGPNEVVILP